MLNNTGTEHSFFFLINLIKKYLCRNILFPSVLNNTETRQKEGREEGMKDRRKEGKKEEIKW